MILIAESGCTVVKSQSHLGNVGLIHFVSMLFSGGSVIFMPRFDVATFFRYLETLGPTWYTGSYTFQHSIHAHAPHFKEAIRRSRLRFILTSSGRLEPHIADDLERTFGVPMLEGYGTTETGRISDNPLPPRKRKRGTVGLPVAREVGIMDADGYLLPSGEGGEVVVRCD